MTSGGYFGSMKAVGVKALKAKLGEYVRMAKAGETILVTEREEVVAELRPARRQPLAEGTLEDRLRDLADQGQVTLRSADKPWSEVRPPRAVSGISSQHILDLLREEWPAESSSSKPLP